MYIRVYKTRRAGDGSILWQATWSDTVDSAPSGSFEWRGRRLVWVVRVREREHVIDGFLFHSQQNDIFINPNGYGIVYLSSSRDFNADADKNMVIGSVENR